jgi:hypothetical protein
LCARKVCGAGGISSNLYGGTVIYFMPLIYEGRGVSLTYIRVTGFPNTNFLEGIRLRCKGSPGKQTLRKIDP